jgi:hypothetical protein
MGYVYENENTFRPASSASEHDPRIRRKLVSFQSNVPEKVTLTYPNGVHKDGMYGPRVMYTLCDGRLMYLDPAVASKINAMEIGAGQEFWICKRKPVGRGQATRWDVYLEDPTARPDETPLESDLRLRLDQAQCQRPSETQTQPPYAAQPPTPVQSTREPAPQEVAIVSANPAPRKHAAWAQTLINQTNELVDAYAAALQHAGNRGLAVKPEDVRTLLVTAFINLAQRGRNAV